MKFNRYTMPIHSDFDNEHTKQAGYFNAKPLRGRTINHFETVHTCTKCFDKGLILNHYEHTFQCRDCGYTGKFTYQLQEIK